MKNRLFVILGFVLLFLFADRLIGFGLNYGLNRYFGLNIPAKILFVGHSHLMLATDKPYLEKELRIPIAKYCREGVNVEDRYQMVKHYLDTKHADSLKLVLYGVDQFMFTGEGLSANSYKLFYPFMDENVMNDYIYQQASSLDYWQHKLIHTTRYSDALLNSAIRGWMSNWSNYKYGFLNVESLEDEVKKGSYRKINFEKDLIETFEKTLNLIKSKGIHIILVNTPIAKPLNESEPSQYAKIINYFKKLDSQDELLTYLDFNPQYEDHYDLFFDPIHLNPQGQKIISQELLKFIKDFRVNE